MDEYTRTNLAHWDELVPIHRDSEFYDLPGFRAGRCSLDPVEVSEIGDVRGKRLLHLQCHFGMDTLSWARRGAEVTGVDFSGEAVTLARQLAGELEIPATFVQSDIYELPQHLEGEWDIVYTAAGALYWLHSMPEWARIAARYVRPGGFLYVREIHPVGLTFDDARGDTELVVRYPYFGDGEAQRWESEAGYASGATPRQHRVTYEWNHTLGEIVSAVCAAGLRLEFLHEFPQLGYQALGSMVKDAEGEWRVPGKERAAPFQFSLKALKR